MPPTDESRKRTQEEIQKLEGMVDSFAEEMKRKLRAKVYDGYGGWDNKRNQYILERKMMIHVGRLMKGEAQHVDVANLVAFLWYLEQKKQEEEDE